jgi:hypothetical protein
MTAKPQISCRLRFGNSAQIRDNFTGDLEAVFAGKKAASAALGYAVSRGEHALAPV